MKNTIKLTKLMRKVLTELVENKTQGFKGNTVNALIDRGLVFDNGELTQEGREIAITLLSLGRQCEQLDLPLYKAAGPYDSSPEYFLCKYLMDHGFDGGAYCEGGAFLILIRASALSILTELNTFGSKEDACSRFTEAQFTILKDKSDKILDVISNVAASQIGQNFQEIYKYDIVREAYPGLEAKFILSIFEAIGPECLSNISKLLFEDPYAYRKGWPDLTMVRDGKICFIEVKTSDRLHLSQIKTIPRLMETVPAEFMVVQLKNAPKTQINFPYF